MKSVVSASDFAHSAGMVFPVSILGLSRSEIISIGSGNKHLIVKYNGYSDDGNKMALTMAVFPNMASSIFSLREVYLQAVSSMGKDKGGGTRFIVENATLSFENAGFRIKGLTARTLDGSDFLAVMECGRWMLEVRVSSLSMDMEEYDSLLGQILSVVNPVILVQRDPWTLSHQSILIDTDVLNDETLAICVMMGAYAHAAWIMANVDSLERCSGVPGLYMEGYAVALKLIVSTWEEHGKHYVGNELNYLVWLKNLIDKGFLEEYLMDKYANTLLIPDHMVLDRDAYSDWMTANRIEFNLRKNYYSIAYLKRRARGRL